MSKKRGEGGDSDKLILKRAVKKKVDFLLKKPEIDSVAAYNLVKGFFQAFVGEDFEFTREELVSELDKIYLEEETKRRLEEIINKLGRVEFSQPRYSQEELREMLEYFSTAVDEIVHAETSELGFWDKFVKKLKSHLSKHHSEEKEGEKEEKTPMEKFLNEADMEMDSQPEMEDSPGQISAEKPPKPSEEPQETKEIGSFDEVPGFDEDQEESGESPEELPMFERDLNAEARDKGSSSQHAEEDFESKLKEFRQDLNQDVMMAQLDYEELKHEYDLMTDEEKEDHYDDLINAYNSLKEAIDRQS